MTTDDEPSEPARRLEEATERLEAVEETIEEHGEDDVERAARAYRRATTLLDNYVDRAIGTGREEFRSYVELEANFERLVQSLPESLPARDAFVEARELLDKRRLREADFERASAALEPAERFAELLEEREDATRELRSARRSALDRLEVLEAEIETLERLASLSDEAVAAAEERLRGPIEAYNGAIEEAFEDYIHDASARAVFQLLDRSRLYPFVPFERPPDALRRYVEADPAGEYTVPQLLEYAEYSRSKLDHYVDDADELKRQIATERTYLRELDAAPLTVDWPPPPAGVLEAATAEFVPFVERVAGSSVVAQLREVEALARLPEYEELRTAAAGAAGLDEDDRKRLETGDPEPELTARREERDRLEAALED